MHNLGLIALFILVVSYVSAASRVIGFYVVSSVVLPPALEDTVPGSAVPDAAVRTRFAQVENTEVKSAAPSSVAPSEGNPIVVAVNSGETQPSH